MKIIFNLLVVALAVVAGWYAQPGFVKWLEDHKANKIKQKKEELAAAVREVTGANPKTAASSGPAEKSSAQQLLESMKKSGPTPQPVLPGGTAKTGMEKPADTATPVVAQVDEFEAKYPLPTFKDITEITKEWSSIPSRAFPRPVKTLVAINLEGPAGKVPLAANSDALAVGMTQGMLVLMKSRSDPARSLVPLANTDLKETLTALYEKYKTYKIDQVMKQRERARGLKARANGATDAELAAVGPKPAVESGGVIPVMLKSLEAKEITETTADRITAWGGLNIEKINGQDYWTGTIQCTVDNAIFGPTPTELMALIKDDKVVKWLYSGSKEEVQ
jgi:hypothetical protein